MAPMTPKSNDDTDALAPSANVQADVRMPSAYQRVTKAIGRGINALVGARQAASSEPLPLVSVARLRAALRALRPCFVALSTDVTAQEHAAQLIATYGQLNRAQVQQLLAAMVKEAQAVQPQVKGKSDWLDGPHARFFKRFNALPGGLQFLLKLRVDMWTMRHDISGMDDLEQTLGDLFAAWFDVGFLELRSITWDSPASLLEKLMHYEAVHAIASWDDLRDRLDRDRVCYAFFHPRMPDEPLIFVEVALTRELTASIDAVLDQSATPEDPARCRWAIFYSITNTQPALRGVSFGNFLLKRVINEIREHLPHLKDFATLSPIPGFARWLNGQDEQGLQKLVGERLLQKVSALDAVPNRMDGPAIATRIAGDSGTPLAPLPPPLATLAQQLALAYLVTLDGNGMPIDPVARFHLGNGARIERLNIAADRSHKGMAQSLGLMVNYLYELDELDANRARLSEGHPALGKAVRRYT
jgi:malonyl-CoA decarboxylase